MSEDIRPEDNQSREFALDDDLADQLEIDDAFGVNGGGPHLDANPPVSASEPEPGEAPSSEPLPAEPPAASGPRHARRRSAARKGGGENAGDGEDQARKRKKAPWWELPALAIFAVAIAVLVKTFIVQPFYIPSQSMEKTLHGCPGCSGDRILVNKPIYDLRDPHPGDIVVFHAPSGWDEEPASTPPHNPLVRAVRGFGQLIGFVPPDGLVLVKRVIAIGGQTVKGTADGSVYVSASGPDGHFHKLNEPFVFEDGPDSHAAFGPVTVPKNRLWVMGDHRNDSADSRFHCDASGSGSNIGPDCDPMTSTVPIGKVIGKAVVIAWPPSRWRTLGTPSTFKQLAMASGTALPTAGSAALVMPVWLIRRRRRRRRPARPPDEA